jgi:hypothetical protein
LAPALSGVLLPHSCSRDDPAGNQLINVVVWRLTRQHEQLLGNLTAVAFIVIPVLQGFLG